MAYTVRWTLQAIDQIEAILTYLAIDSPVYAADLVDDLLMTASTLTEFPFRGRSRYDKKGRDVREIFIQNYRLVYRVKSQLVEIIDVIHMSRDL